MRRCLQPARAYGGHHSPWRSLEDTAALSRPAGSGVSTNSSHTGGGWVLYSSAQPPGRRRPNPTDSSSLARRRLHQAQARRHPPQPPLWSALDICRYFEPISNTPLSLHRVAFARKPPKGPPVSSLRSSEYPSLAGSGGISRKRRSNGKEDMVLILPHQLPPSHPRFPHEQAYHR